MLELKVELLIVLLLPVEIDPWNSCHLNLGCKLPAFSAMAAEQCSEVAKNLFSSCWCMLRSLGSFGFAPTLLGGSWGRSRKSTRVSVYMCYIDQRI